MLLTSATCRGCRFWELCRPLQAVQLALERTIQKKNWPNCSTLRNQRVPSTLSNDHSSVQPRGGPRWPSYSSRKISHGFWCQHDTVFFIKIRKHMTNDPATKDSFWKSFLCDHQGPKIDPMQKQRQTYILHAFMKEREVMWEKDSKGWRPTSTQIISDVSYILVNLIAACLCI